MSRVQDAGWASNFSRVSPGPLSSYTSGLRITIVPGVNKEEIFLEFTIYVQPLEFEPLKNSDFQALSTALLIVRDVTGESDYEGCNVHFVHWTCSFCQSRQKIVDNVDIPVKKITWDSLGPLL